MPTHTKAEIPAGLDVDDLRCKVRRVYEAVARHPLDGPFHFEVGRALAETLGYASEELDFVPGEALESFAGVGYHFDLAALSAGERVVDLGSGSGSDVFIAARRVGTTGRVTGVDMTDAQRDKASALAQSARVSHVTFLAGLIEHVPLPPGEVDCVISNGAINLCPDKGRVFAEAARLLRPGGRLAVADIVADRALPGSVTCNATLWAACVGGAVSRDAYRTAMEAAGLRAITIRENPAYGFLSKSAQNTSRDYGVKSVSILAIKDAIPKPVATLDAYGLSCGSLEPLIARHLRALAPGDVLEIRSDQAEAADGIGAWVWLSGHTLVARESDGRSPRASYYVRKNPPRRAAPRGAD